MFVVLAKRRDMLEPFIDVLDQPAFVVVYVNACGDMHGRDQDHAFFHAALTDKLFNLWGDVNVCTVSLGMKAQIFCKGLHRLNVTSARSQRSCRWRSDRRFAKDLRT